jgi:hypothetical protein
MGKIKNRNPEDWMTIPIKKETSKKLNIKKQELNCKNIDELINKLLDKK